MSEIHFIHARVIIWYEDLDKERCMLVADKHKASALNSSFWILDLQTTSQMDCLSRSCQGNSMHEGHGIAGPQILKQLYEPLTSASTIQCFALPQHYFDKSCGNCFAIQQHEGLAALPWFTEHLSQQKNVFPHQKGQENRETFFQSLGTRSELSALVEHRPAKLVCLLAGPCPFCSK